jgi:hypothetical protein
MTNIKRSTSNMTNLTHEEIFAAIRYLDPDLRVMSANETTDSVLGVCVSLLLLFSILAFAFLFLRIS